MSPRQYRLGKRQQHIDETRARVVEAAHTLFSNPGYHQVTIEHLAREAGVARATIYHQFGTKVHVLEALMAELAESDGALRIRRVREHENAATALRLYIPELCRFWGREEPFFRQLFGILAVEPDAMRLMELYEGRRREFVTWLVKRLDDQGHLRPGMSQRIAADIIWLLTSFQSFDQLRRRSGLSVRATSASLATLAATVLKGREPVAPAETEAAG